MAKRRMYKQVKTQSKDMGSAGSQILLGTISPLDVQVGTGYLKNVVCTALLNDGDGDNGGFMFYLSTSNSWNDDYVLTARACQLGGTVSLSAAGHNFIRDDVADVSRNDGELYVWGEVTDLGTTQNTARIVLEAWGRFIVLS